VNNELEWVVDNEKWFFVVESGGILGREDG
jgi:hypothetical protein